ncbi:DNA repair protein RecO [Paenibacillaceae bacterium]|nr:DNA repair protein RecO [Paenibacillaceae bacterium]
MQYRVEGIVIRSMDYGEGNKIVTILTETHGKAGIIVRGAKKLKSRYGSLVQPFTWGEFIYFKKGGLGTLKHGEIIESHHLLRESLELAAYASYTAELVDRVLQDNEAGSYLYNQLKALYGALAEGKDPQITTHLFEMKILEAAGYGPELSACISCGEESGPFVLSFRAGGVLCKRCLMKDPEHLALGEGAIKLMRVFKQMDLRRLGEIQVRKETRQALKIGMRKLMDTHLGLKLKSRSFLDQLDQLTNN